LVHLPKANDIHRFEDRENKFPIHRNIDTQLRFFSTHRKRKVNDKNYRKPNKKEKISINHKLLSGKPEEFIAKNSVNNHSYF
jgi:hypothetical protein